MKRGNTTPIGGFTLIELMAIVAIVAVLAAIGVPSFRDMLLNQRLATAAQGFNAALGFARMEAIQRAQGVEVAALAGGDWSEGWVVRTGSDASSSTQSQTQTLRRFDRLPQGVSIDATLGGGFAQGLRYDGNGFSRQTARAGFSAGCLTFKAETGRRASVIVSASGRAKVCNPDVSGDCGSGACARGESGGA